MTSLCIISFQHIGTVSAGEGLCNTNFDRLALNITYATWQGEFLTGTIPEVPNDAEYVKQCRDLSTAFPSINKSSLIETSDGVPLAWFIKQGMIFPWGWVGQQLDRLANIAIVTLTKLYKPPTAIKTDVRHELAFAEESAKARGDKAPYSVYHFFFARSTGARSNALFQEAKGNNEREAAAVKDYLYQTKWTYLLLSKWLKVLARATWQRYWTAYQQLSQRGELGVLNVGDMGCFTSHALLIRAAVNPHKDTKDVRDGLVITAPSGSFTGGEVSVMEWGMRFAQQSGDILIAPMQVLTHMLDPIQGVRYGHVYTMHDEIINTPKRIHCCDICATQGIKQDYATKNGLANHKAEKKDDVHRAARARAAYGTNLKVSFDEFMESWEDPADARFPCDVAGCSREYSTFRTLRDHKVRAHGIKPGRRGVKKAPKKGASTADNKPDDVTMGDVSEDEDDSAMEDKAGDTIMKDDGKLGGGAPDAKPGGEAPDAKPGGEAPDVKLMAMYPSGLWEYQYTAPGHMRPIWLVQPSPGQVSRFQMGNCAHSTVYDPLHTYR